MCDFCQKKYEEPRNWIDKQRAKGKLWEDLLYANKGDDKGVEKFLYNQQEDNDWEVLTVSEWKDFVSAYKVNLENSQPVTIPSHVIEEGTENLIEPSFCQSAWQLYKNALAEEKHFSDYAITNIKLSSLDILNRLSKDTAGKDPVKGMVVGNVQSGKTANMGALISMAADYGWNMFIILTGTIENLRRQTQNRFISDLKNGNLSWVSINHPGVGLNNKLTSLALEDKSRIRYVTCCLKNPGRLRHLYKWLNSEPMKKQQLRVLLIDDEADQAGLNTNTGKDYRTTINRLIMDIVNNTGKYSKINYQSMNYVGYTATPYGNFLNETKKESLFPRDFISILTPSDLYFGPQQIFGDPFSSNWQGMSIINRITSENDEEAFGDDVQKMNDLCEGVTGVIPDSLKEAVAWFSVATAIQRIRKDTKPVSMLVHHTMNTASHGSIATGIYEWFSKLSLNDFIVLCEKVYDEQTKQFSKEIFIETCSEYGVNSGLDLEKDINDYPDFESLLPELSVLKARMEHINIDEEGDLSFHDGVHLCVDNSAYDVITATEDDAHVRLIYPTSKQEYDGYAPAFLVVGGNTLSRGLTLEGLVCTYFSREVKLADTLMQMGRWFGYRKGYELLPRIWITEIAEKRYEFLSELDSDLRMNLIKYQSELTPLECAPLIMNTPGTAFLRISAANKTQAMVPAEMNFAGANLQTFIFRNDGSLENNLCVAESFITGLGEPNIGYGREGAKKVWKDITFDRIWDEFLSKSEFRISQIADVLQFKEWIGKLSKDQKLENWSVVLSGTKSNDKDESEIWMGVGKVNRSRKLVGMYSESSIDINIGILSDPNDWKLDLPENFVVSQEEQDILEKKSTASNVKASMELAKNNIREANGMGNVPLLVIYCIDKNSKAGGKTRAPLNADTDIIGIYVRIPGDRTNSDFCAKVTVRVDDEDIDDED